LRTNLIRHFQADIRLLERDTGVLVVALRGFGISLGGKAPTFLIKHPPLRDCHHLGLHPALGQEALPDGYCRVALMRLIGFCFTSFGQDDISR
jgi:hypothetical protein